MKKLILAAALSCVAWAPASQAPAAGNVSAWEKQAQNITIIRDDWGIPHVYGKTDAGGSSVLSLMGNLLIGVPFGGQQGFGFRPFGLVGFGALRSDLDSFTELVGFDNTEVAWNFGGGVMIFFGSNVGILGDVRYFRTFGDVNFGPLETADTDAVDYTRGSIGLVLRF